LDIHRFFPGSWKSNCYVIIGKSLDGSHALIVDPSLDAGQLVDFLKEKNARLDAIVLTHGHFDHILTLDDLRDRTGAPVYIHKDDAEMLADGEKNAFAFFFGYDMKRKDADRLLDDGEIILLGDEELKVISTPGHSKGSICLMGDRFMVTGDTIFAQGFGRCDLHGGDAETLKRTINMLKSFDGSLTIYPGHGDSEKLGVALRNVSYFLN
jgi:glyoxylase-like metal-dependent hydrolase (beta-lactamase superfamily II)